MTRTESCSYTNQQITERIISSFFSRLAESWHDPVLRQWRWERLRGRAKPVADAVSRPGDAAAAGADLYLGGLAAKDEDRVARGLRQLLGGLEKGVGASGATLEGSTFRQAQLAHLVTEAWAAARDNARPEQWRLAAAARSLVGAYDALHLSGGLPQIGERPETGTLPASLASVEEIRGQSKLHDLEALRRDGWLRLDQGPWSGLWHCPVGGWPSFAGLAHHDLGAAELHWNGLPLLVDPGSGHREATAHGGLTIDRENPYPETRAGYTEAFRRAVAGPAPELRSTHDGAKLAMDGFGRFGGHVQIERSWHFDGAALRIEDLVLGTGRPLIERRLVTPWAVSRGESGVILSQGDHRFRLAAEGTIAIEPAEPRAGLTLIVVALRANLPWSGALTLQPITA